MSNQIEGVSLGLFQSIDAPSRADELWLLDERLVDDRLEVGARGGVPTSKHLVGDRAHAHRLPGLGERLADGLDETYRVSSTLVSPARARTAQRDDLLVDGFDLRFQDFTFLLQPLDLAPAGIQQLF